VSVTVGAIGRRVQGERLAAKAGIRAALVVVSVAAVASAGCGFGANRATSPPGFQECVDAWNAPGNGSKRLRADRRFVSRGYRDAGVQLNLTVGESWLPDERQRDVNPIGCRVVFFTRDRWIAYNARRDGDQFRFPMVVPGGRWSDQRGSWSRVTRHPHNATIVEDARIALSRGGAPIAPWRQLLNDWWRDGRVDGVYRCSTYRAVFRRLPRDDPYSAARPDIQNALQNRGCVR